MKQYNIPCLHQIDTVKEYYVYITWVMNATAVERKTILFSLFKKIYYYRI